MNSPASLNLQHAVLIDGTGSQPVPYASLVIRDGRIVRLGAGVELDPAAEVLDLQGRVVLPGFFNCHVHRACKAAALRTWAGAGVTTVRDLGANNRPDLFAERDRLRQYNRHARLLSVGPLIGTQRGYGSLKVTSAEDARQKVRALAGYGADCIKIGIEDHLQFRRYHLMPLEEIRAVVDEAHRHGLRVAAHVTRVHHLELALAGGVDELAHMVIEPIPDELLARCVERGLVIVPTLELWAGVSRLYRLDWIRHALDNLARFVDFGGKAALGTDFAGHGVPFDDGLPLTEIGLMHSAGLSPMQIILSATRDAAYTCGLHDTGTLAPGKAADLLILEEDPLQDLAAFRQVYAVFRNGERIQ